MILLHFTTLQRSSCVSFCCRHNGGPAAVRVRPQLSAALAADLQSADSGSLPRTPMSPSDDQDEAAHEADSAAFWLANQVLRKDKMIMDVVYKTARGCRALDGALGLSAAERPLHCYFLLEHADASGTWRSVALSVLKHVTACAAHSAIIKEELSLHHQRLIQCYSHASCRSCRMMAHCPTLLRGRR